MVTFVEPQNCEQVVRWLGETKGFWVQTGALFLSAIGALWIVLSRARSERRRATVEMVLHTETNAELKDAKKVLLALIDSGETNLAKFLSQKDSPEYKSIMRVLNNHEFVACGIREKAYDEVLYKRMQCSVIVRDWQVLCGFVEEFRNSKKGRIPGHVDTKTFYNDFQKLAQKWEKNPLKPS